jgi:hypothetical protein
LTFFFSDLVLEIILSDKKASSIQNDLDFMTTAEQIGFYKLVCGGLVLAHRFPTKGFTKEQQFKAAHMVRTNDCTAALKHKHCWLKSDIFL